MRVVGREVGGPAAHLTALDLCCQFVSQRAAWVTALGDHATFTNMHAIILLSDFKAELGLYMPT